MKRIYRCDKCGQTLTTAVTPTVPPTCINHLNKTVVEMTLVSHSITDNCPNCDGTGNTAEYEHEYHRCHRCNGKGWIK